ncbi:hypothetical protein BC831DRAFT_436246 [Entophlyctis helioformis]|nr:hypothetical protein BC831DRAFT_436246 [Entophlyctis helioformis]
MAGMAGLSGMAGLRAAFSSCAAARQQHHQHHQHHQQHPRVKVLSSSVNAGTLGLNAASAAPAASAPPAGFPGAGALPMSVAAIAAAPSILLYSHPNKQLFSLLYVAGFAHFVFWLVLAGLSFSEMTNSSPGILSAKVVGSEIVKPKSKNDNTVTVFGITKHWPAGMEGIWIKAVFTTALASVGFVFLGLTHRYASRYASQIELVHGKILRVKSSALVGNPFRDLPFSTAALSEPVFTGFGPGMTEVFLDRSKIAWYKWPFVHRRAGYFWLADSTTKSTFRVDRQGSFRNPQFMDRLFAEKAAFTSHASLPPSSASATAARVSR